LFTREGNDLKYYALLTFKESIIGKTFTIDHFSGPIEVNTRDFGVIQVAKKYEIRDKGMPIDAAKTRFGNLIIQFDISYPSAPLDSNAIAVLEGALNTLNL
jgi:DnaJ-class molecular chaperone